MLRIFFAILLTYEKINDKITIVINNKRYFTGGGMPAKKQISRNDIIEAAFEIVRKEGMEALNMRSVAKKCKCSTQPIYLSFKGADELKAEVSKRGYEEFTKFIANEMASGKYPEYKGIGMGYVRFAAEEPELFKHLFMRRRDGEATDYEKFSYDQSAMVIMKNYGLYKNDAEVLHAEMWVFVHGIATMLVTKYMEWDWETVSKMLSDVYLGLTERIKKGENK